MERHVKERLIGAAVLVAAAVILIPEMLSGSNPQHAVEPAAASDAAPLKTYTIDLSKSPTAQAAATASALDERAPPAQMPSTADPASAPQAGPESANAEAGLAQPQSDDDATVPVEAQPAGVPASSRVAESGPSPQAKPANSPPRVVQAAPSPPKPANAAPATAQAKPAASPRTPEATPARAAPLADGHWAVQLGSFSSRATAEKMAKDLRADGQAAFVMPVKSGAATLYRVRVGPMQDRQAAQQVLNRLKAKTPGAAIVPHP